MNDRPRCAAMIYSGSWPTHCSRYGVIERDGKMYCRQHDPVAVKARREERDRRWRAEWAAEDELNRKRKAVRDAERQGISALYLIADGHNDPRQVAAEAVAAIEAASDALKSETKEPE